MAMYLKYFTSDESFPFYIQNGYHGEDFDNHTHADFTELVIVLNGTAVHCVDEDTYFVKKGDVFVVNNNTEHGYRNVNDFSVCNIMYRPQLIPQSLDIRQSAGFHALFVIEPHLAKSRSFQSRLTLKFEDFKHINKIIEVMYDEYQKKPEGWKTLLQANFMTLIVTLSRLYYLPSPDVKSDIMNIAKSVSYMEKHYNEPISINTIAACSNLSERHFARIFKDTYQITPCNYILNLKMQHACRLLKSTTLSILEIAYQSGFNDSNYFTRQFRKVHNTTPRKYREKNKEYHKGGVIL